VFTQLVDDTDRNAGNILIDKDWKIYLIDFTRAFRRPHELRAPQLLQRCDKNLLQHLRDLKVEDVKARISKWVPPREIESMMARRDALVALYDKLIAERGEARVLF
jgi:RIO-like serine/threonine protein kinase